MRTRATIVGASALLMLVGWACSGSSDDHDAPGGSTGGPDGGGADEGGDGGGLEDGGADGATSFTPASLGSRLVLWLDAARTVGVVDAGRDADTVGSWGDLSGNTNNALQAIPALEPVLLSGSTEAGVSGHPVIAFNGANRLVIPESPSLLWGKEDFVLLAVFRQSMPTATYGLVVGKYLTAAPFAGPQLYANYFNPGPSTDVVGRLDSAHFARTPDGGYNDGKVHVAALRRSGTSVEIRVDGTSTVNADAGNGDGGPIDVSAPDSGVFIGARPPGGASFFAGSVAEIIGVHGHVTDPEMLQIEDYLRTKYGL